MGAGLNQSKTEFFNTIQVSIPQLKLSIKDALETNIPLNVLGPTGIGKTEIIKSVAKEENCYLIDLNTTTSDVLDIGGLPFRTEKDRLKFALSEFLPIRGSDEGDYTDYKYVILFIDEMPLAPRELQSVLYKMVQERMVRQSFLLDKVRIISAGNLKTDLGNHNEPPAPLKNREHHIYLRPDAQGWCEWAMGNGIHPSIISFIQGQPNMIHVLEDPERAKNYKQYTENYAFNTNRSWTDLSADVYLNEKRGIDDSGRGVNNTEYFRLKVHSHVGLVGTQYFEFYQNSLALPPISEVLSGVALDHINKWRKAVNDSAYTQSLHFYLSYLLCSELGKHAKALKARGNEFYYQDKQYSREIDNAFEFLDQLTDNDPSVLQAFYFNYTVRFGLIHDLFDDNNSMTKYVNSSQMERFNEYELKTDK